MGKNMMNIVIMCEDIYENKIKMLYGTTAHNEAVEFLFLRQPCSFIKS
jgi:hypothetical protein